MIKPQYQDAQPFSSVPELIWLVQKLDGFMGIVVNRLLTKQSKELAVLAINYTTKCLYSMLTVQLS